MAAANQRKQNSLSRNQCKQMKRTQAKREVFQAQQRSKLATVHPYLSKDRPGNAVKQPPIAPIEKNLDKKIGKHKIMKPSNTLLAATDINVLASKTEGLKTNLPVSAVSDSMAVINGHAMQTKKLLQPCYIQRGVWQKQMNFHISRLKVLGRAPSDGCTVAHVISKHELDEIVAHGARVIHLTNPMQDQVTGNISWAVASQGVLNNNGEMLLTKSAIF